MKKNTDPSAETAELRRRAEEQLKGKKPNSGTPRTELETVRLVHELQVHQIELEMQNEELKASREKAEAALALYEELYDFAPTSYLTIDREGIIRRVNLTGARILGVERSQLVNRRFGLFVADKDRHAFSDFLARVFSTEARQTSELALATLADLPSLVVRVEATLSPLGTDCRTVLIDISESRIQAEKIKRQLEELRVQNDTLSRFNRVAVGRELRMVELKREINELCQKCGEPPRHKIAESVMPTGASMVAQS